MQGIRIDFNDPKQLPYKWVLRDLFIHPKVAMVLATIKGCWFRNLLVLLAITLAGSFIKSYRIAPAIAEEAGIFIDDLISKTGDIRVVNNQLVWDNVQAAPLTTYFSQIRVDVLNSIEEADIPALSTERIPLGFILHHDGVNLWHKDPETHQFNMQELPVMSYMKTISNFLPASANGRPAPILDSQYTRRKTFLPSIVLGMTISLFWSIFVESLFSVLVFSVVIMITRRRTPFGTLRGAISMASAVCIPPALAAQIYCQTGTDMYYDTLFTIMFAIYILYMYIEGRHTILGLTQINTKK